MKKFQSILVVVITFLVITRLYAEDQIPSKEIDFTIDDTSINYYADNNPFKSLLPEVDPNTGDNYSDGSFNDQLLIPIPEGNIQPQPAAVPEPVKPTPPALTLNGIVWNTDRPQAIINDQVLSQGDTIEGARIVSIRKSGINLVFENENFTLKP